jgi:hypothetical protein
MIKYTIFFLLLITFSLSFSQSKKEEIEILKLQVDSINKVMTSERNTHSQNVIVYNSNISNLNLRIDSLYSILKSSREALLFKEIEFKNLGNKLDEANKNLALSEIILDSLIKVQANKDIGNVILYLILNGFEENETNEKYAVPFLVFYNNEYINPPTCEVGSTDKKAVLECERAKNMLLPSVQKGDQLFIINDGKQVGEIEVLGTKEFGYSDWIRYSAHISTNVKESILTDNPKVGNNDLIKTNDPPILQARKGPEGEIYEDRLVGKLDIDGDGLPEFIFEGENYEGTIYQIYSKKRGNWQKVYEDYIGI